MSEIKAWRYSGARLQDGIIKQEVILKPSRYGVDTLFDVHVNNIKVVHIHKTDLNPDLLSFKKAVIYFTEERDEEALQYFYNKARNTLDKARQEYERALANSKFINYSVVKEK